MNSKIATLFMVVWLVSALTSIITLPDYERYHGRIERTENYFGRTARTGLW